MVFVYDFNNENRHDARYIDKLMFFDEIDRLFNDMSELNIDFCNCVLFSNFKSIDEFIGHAKRSGYSVEYTLTRSNGVSVFILAKNGNIVLAHAEKEGQIFVVALIKENISS